MLNNLTTVGSDKIVELMYKAMNDTRNEKLDLTVGVYKINGQVPMMKAVREADKLLAEQRPNKMYVGPLGDDEFLTCLAELALPNGTHNKTMLGAQTPGASSAFRMVLDVIKQANENAKVWISDPSYTNHEPTIIASGLKLGYFPLFDKQTVSYQRELMLEKFSMLSENDVVVLHGCCHNPSGLRIPDEDWLTIAELAQKKGFFIIVDTAYHGLGDGLIQDTKGIDYLLQKLPELALCYSCSKNFGLYSDRTGAAFFIGDNDENIKKAQLALAVAARPTHWVPPNNGAQIVKTILTNKILKQMWISELEQMRERVVNNRQALVQELRKLSGTDYFDFFEQQYGMFSMLPATTDQMKILREEHAVYGLPDGRLNIAALEADNVKLLAKALHAVLHAK